MLAASLDSVEEQTRFRVVAEIAFVGTCNLGNVEFRPSRAVRRHGKTFVQKRCLEPAGRIGFARIIDGHVDSHVGLRTGRPMQSVSALPQVLIDSQDP